MHPQGRSQFFQNSKRMRLKAKQFLFYFKLHVFFDLNLIPTSPMRELRMDLNTEICYLMMRTSTALSNGVTRPFMVNSLRMTATEDLIDKETHAFCTSGHLHFQVFRAHVRQRREKWLPLERLTLKGTCRQCSCKSAGFHVQMPYKVPGPVARALKVAISLQNAQPPSVDESVLINIVVINKTLSPMPNRHKSVS